MVRNRFDRQLKDLNRQMTAMGKLCELAITGATTALATGNEETAREVIRADAQIDQAERDIEHLCMKLLLQQQPVARDLRQISAALKMITDLERIGDQAADIAEIVITSELTGVVEYPKILQMSKLATQMVADAITAYVKRDLPLTESVLEQDNAVDTAFMNVRAALIRVIVHESRAIAAPLPGNGDAQELAEGEELGVCVKSVSTHDSASAEEKHEENSQTTSAPNESFSASTRAELNTEAEALIDLVMIAKYLERIGDHATNVAEWVAFSITGVHNGRLDTKSE